MTLVPVSSMTGFARAIGADDRFSWTWELRSVNGRTLETRFRLPPGWDHLLGEFRRLVGERLQRGNLQLSLTLIPLAPATSLRVNEPALNEVLALIQRLHGLVEAQAPTLDGILNIRGVLEAGEEPPTEEEQVARERAVAATLEEALHALHDARHQEGRRIQSVIVELVDGIEELVERARETWTAHADRLPARLREQLDLLLSASPPVPEERLAQELTIQLVKCDVREELDRLTAHVGAARELIAKGGPIGRKFDFLCQEFNREANTLCSKSADMTLTRLGIDLKVRIDQLREQVQNLE